MKSQPQRYRGFDIAKMPRRRIGAFGDTYIVLTWRGEKLSAHSSLREAKAEVDRLLVGSNRTDASGHGCPI
jgi:hypothetical protein